MKEEVKEITVFTIGDSSKISTWSNIPYFFTETLIMKSIKVNRVDLSPSPLVIKIFRGTALPVLRMIYKNTTYNYLRTFTHFVNVRYRVKKAVKKFPYADINLFLTFSFSSIGLTQKPTVLLCDWTYEYFLMHFKNKKPDFLEKLSINRENRQIENADLVVLLFNSMKSHMNLRYINPKISYLGNYVINSLYVASERDMLNKKNSYSILFVGNKYYKEGAKSLIDALKIIKNDYPNAKLNIVGMDASNFKKLPEYVKCYGFLDKGNPAEREIFHQLFKTARVFVNTNPKWGAFSTTIEAMYSYIPIVVSPYDEFVSTFGKNINFGCYCNKNGPDKIAEKIRIIFDSPNYHALCVNAHNAVKDFTWSSYIDKFLMQIKSLE